MLSSSYALKRAIPPFLPEPEELYPPGFETLTDVWRRRNTVVRALRALGTSDALKLAEKLYRCRPKACSSGACPICNRAFRARFQREVVTNVPADAEILRVSLVPRAFRHEVGRLKRCDFERWVKSRHQGLARALPKNSLFIGGVDLSLNSFENCDLHWSVHVYGFVILPAGWGSTHKSRRARLRERIERYCPPMDVQDRLNGELPLKIGPRSRSDFERRALYVHKGAFYRRSRYAYIKFVTGKPSTNARPQRLRGVHLAEVALFLDRFPLGRRLLLIGMRRRGDWADFALYRERDFQSPREPGAMMADTPKGPSKTIEGPA